jgi:hypothetical protein
MSEESAMRDLVEPWTDRLIERLRSYGDIDEARAAAERLAEKRG